MHFRCAENNAGFCFLPEQICFPFVFTHSSGLPASRTGYRNFNRTTCVSKKLCENQSPHQPRSPSNPIRNSNPLRFLHHNDQPLELQWKSLGCDSACWKTTISINVDLSKSDPNMTHFIQKTNDGLRGMTYHNDIIQLGLLNVLCSKVNGDLCERALP